PRHRTVAGGEPPTGDDELHCSHRGDREPGSGVGNQTDECAEEARGCQADDQPSRVNSGMLSFGHVVLLSSFPSRVLGVGLPPMVVTSFEGLAKRRPCPYGLGAAPARHPPAPWQTQYKPTAGDQRMSRDLRRRIAAPNTTTSQAATAISAKRVGR